MKLKKGFTTTKISCWCNTINKTKYKKYMRNIKKITKKFWLKISTQLDNRIINPTASFSSCSNICISGSFSTFRLEKKFVYIYTIRINCSIWLCIHLIISYMLWFNKILRVLSTLINGEVSFLSNSNFDGQVEVIDTKNLILFLPIKETFNYSITYTE